MKDIYRRLSDSHRLLGLQTMPRSQLQGSGGPTPTSEGFFSPTLSLRHVLIISSACPLAQDQCLKTNGHICLQVEGGNESIAAPPRKSLGNEKM